MKGGGDSVDGTVHKTPSRAVVEAVADAEGVSPTELRPPEYEPLHAAVDPEALDSLFADRASGAPRSDGTVSFRYCGYQVTVAADGSVSVAPVEEADDE
ncbi:HalOD1 output domain-containing protein [Halopiger thermotolerans]